MHTDRADLVLQYVLASAGERHGVEREVSLVQIVKYAYLADVAYAERNEGETFTAAPWRFANLGPHAPELEARVAPVARRIGATTRGALYLLDDDDLGHRRAAELALPAAVTGAIRNAQRSFVRDTNGLLVHVYATAPMRRCAPGDALDFTPVAKPLAGEVVAPPTPLSSRARAALSARRAMPSTPQEIVAPPVDAPRYDDARFMNGQRALDAAERALVACAGSLDIDASTWSAPGRRQRDDP